MKTTRLLVTLIALLGVWQGMFAENQAYAVLDDNGKLKFYYDENMLESEVYSIPWINYPGWYNERENIKTVEFDASFSNYRLESAAEMFSNCDNLTSIDFANFNTEDVTNMSYMFVGCSSLTSLDVSSLNTSSVTNMTQMFSDCSALTEIIFTKEGAETVFNTENVTDMSSMFYGCSSLEELDLSSFNTTNVTDMWSMFSRCASLKKLDLSSFNTTNVTSMANMFYECTSLKELVLWSFETANVTYMSDMFDGCASLEELDLSSFNTTNVTDMSSMFKGCASLKELDIRNFNTSSVTDMSNMFRGCAELTSLDLSNFETTAPHQLVLTSMFQDCSKLKNLDIRYFSISGDDLASNMFRDCSSLEEILCLNTWYPGNNYSNSYNSQNMFSGCTNLKGGKGSVYNTSYLNFLYAHPDGGTYENRPSAGYFTEGKPYAILSDGTLTFYYDLEMNTRSGVSFVVPADDSAPGWTSSEYVSSITTVTFDESFLKYTEITSPKSLFTGLSSLTTINNLRNLPTANVTDMSYMFSGFSSLTSIDLTNFNTSIVTNMSHMFEDCSSLTSLDLSELNTENVTDISYMFKGCSGLESQNLVLPDLNYYNYFSNDHLNNLSHMFEGCSSLTGIDVSKINTAYVTDMSYMFSGCRSLTSLDLYDFQTSEVEDMSFMFNGCSSLETIYCSYDWAEYGKVTSETSVNMFAGCENLVGAISYEDNSDTEHKNDITYANPTNGYFSIKREAYAYIDGNSLIFCYDTHKFERYMEGGDDFGSVFPVKEKPEIDENSEWDEEWARWIPYSKGVTKVIFDPSFDDFRPKSTISWFSSMSMVNSFVGLEYLHTEAVTDMSGMFIGCYSLTSLDLTSFNTANVTDMSYMFAECNYLESLNLTSFDVSNVTVMDNMFADCGRLEMIYAEDWSNIERDEDFSSSSMFEGCENLPNWDESNSNDINFAKPSENGGYFSTRQVYAIVEDDKLTFHYDGYNFQTTYTIDQTAGGTWKNAPFTTVTFDPSFADYKLTSTAEMFSGLTGLTTINDLDNLNTSSITDMRNMFNGCTNLKTIYCGKDWSRLKVPSTGMFAGCTSLVGAIPYDSNKTDITYANPYDGYFYQPQAYAVQEGSVLTFYYDNQIDEHADAITYEIPWGVFDAPGWTSNNEITQVVFDPSFKFYDGFNSTASMFNDMRNLSSIEGLEYLNTKKVTTTRYMFAGCSSLTSLNLSNFNTSKANQLWCMFQGCSSLTTLDLTNFDMTNVTDVDNLFDGCSSLKTIFCNDDWSDNSFEYSGNIFSNCYSLVGGYGTKYSDVSEDAQVNPLSFAHPDEADNSGFFTALLPDDILLYDTRSNTETISNSNGSVKVFLVDRTLYKTGDWNTLCLPFSLTARQLDESPLAGYTELRTLKEEGTTFDPATGTLTLNFTPATGDDAVTSIEAGKPYIIKWNSGENIVNPIFTNVSLANNSLKPVETDVVSFMGTYDPKPLTSANSNILYLGAGNTLYYPSANMTINSFRAYFELDLTSAQQVKAINLNFGDEENGIQEITTDSNLSNSSNTYFSLDGRRLLDKPTQKGMYINNGRKVLIK